MNKSNAAYSADDREPGEFPTDPTAEYPVTSGERYAAIRGGTPSLQALIALWTERDARYDGQRLTEDQVGSVKRFRLSEVNDLPPQDRGPAAMAVYAWYPR